MKRSPYIRRIVTLAGLILISFQFARCQSPQRNPGSISGEDSELELRFTSVAEQEHQIRTLLYDICAPLNQTCKNSQEVDAMIARGGKDFWVADARAKNEKLREAERKRDEEWFELERFLGDRIQLLEQFHSSRFYGKRTSIPHFSKSKGGSQLSTNPDQLEGSIRETCLYDSYNKGDTALDGFLNLPMTTSSCITGPIDAELVPDAYEGFNKKIESLTGFPLTQHQIEEHDYNKPVIDEKTLPKLDLIMISTLQFKNDYSGNLVARLLEMHANRGAQIWVIAPRTPSLMRPADWRLLNRLAQSNQKGNIHVQVFKYDRSRMRPVEDLFDSMHRTLHAKIWITMSKADPERNVVITGGRNIKDTFLFETSPDLSNWQHLIQYKKDVSIWRQMIPNNQDEPYLYYEDLDVVIRNPEVVQQVAAQFIAFWNRNFKSMQIQPTSLHLPVLRRSEKAHKDALEILKSQTHARHFLSVPFSDHRQIEDLFVDLVRRAKKSIRIVSPYFRPTQRISDAMKSALEKNKNLEINFITTVRLRGDNYPIVEDINKASIGEFLKFQKKVKIFAWKDENSVLHTKTILVDDEILYVGGTNFNSRSFIHDVENGFLLTGPQIVARYNHIFDSYRLKSNEVKGAYGLSLLFRVIKPVLPKSLF